MVKGKSVDVAVDEVGVVLCSVELPDTPRLVPRVT
jgi:hypothetical protein